ncbi:MAG: GAF domain-containing protein [Nitrospirae bacterium]|nr:GAF domain-containing protein [Nitrospirota bacterium]
MNAKNNIQMTLKRISQWSFIITLGISLFSLLGWASGLLILARVNPAYIPMAPSSAFCFGMLSGSLLVCMSGPRDRARRKAAAAGAILTLSTSLIVLVGFAIGTTFSFENLGIRTTESFTNVPIGHMSPITAAIFLMSALSVLFEVFDSEGEKRFKRIQVFIDITVASIGSIIFLGYLYGTPLLYGGIIIPVALPTAVAFVLIGLGMLTSLGFDAPLIRAFIGPTVSDRLMKAFFPVIISFILIDGFLYRTAFLKAANPALITSLITILSVIVFGMIITTLAKSIGSEIDRAHVERDRAEELLRMDEDRLETLLKLSQMQVESENELTDFALEEVVRLTKSKGGYLHFFNEDQQTIQLYSWSRDVLKYCTAVPSLHYPLDKAGIWADSIRFRKPVIHNDYQNISDKRGYPEGHFHLARHLGVAIFDGDQIVGVTGVGNKEEPYNETDVRQITLFMNNMWIILKQRRSEAEKEQLIFELTGALEQVKTLSGLLPICASCKKIRDDKGYWNQIEYYISEHSEAEFTHGICPECVKKLYPEQYKVMLKNENKQDHST